eukprot:g3523.t1
MTQQNLTQTITKYRGARSQAEQQVTQKCTGAEEAMEKAVATHEAIAGAGDDLPQAEKAVQETEEAVREAEKKIGEARVMLTGKMSIAKRFESQKIRENASQELTKMMTKLQTVQSKLLPLKNARNDFQQRKTASSLERSAEQLQSLIKLCTLRKASGGSMVAKELAEPEKRLKALDEKMKSIRAGERTALKDSGSRALLAVRDCEIAITASGTAASIAKVYLTIKGMEVKKFLVQKAEDAAKQVTDAAASLEDEKLATLTHDEIQAATDGTMKAEGELAELQQRVDKARQDTIKQTRLCSTVENRLRALSFVDKTTSEISNLEEQVGRMSELVTKVVESDLEGESLKQAEETSVALQKKVRLQKRELDDYGSTRDEAVGDAAAKLLDRLKPVLQKCEDALTSVRAHSQKVAVRTAMAECARKVGETEAAVKLSKEAEEAFQTAAKQPEAVQEEATAMANLESAIKAANSLINSTKALLSLKRVDMKRQELSGTSWEELDNLQKRLDDCTQQLAEHKKVVADRQNEVTSREMSSKLQGVQKLVEAYRAQAATMESLSPEQPEWREAGEQLKLVADAVTELDRLADCRLPRHGSSEILSEKLTILKQVEDMKAELEGWQKQFEELQARNAIQKLIKEN